MRAARRLGLSIDNPKAQHFDLSRVARQSQRSALRCKHIQESPHPAFAQDISCSEFFIQV